jgi:peptidyl-tRNA hydrolase
LEIETEKFVLQKFTLQEEKIIQETIKKAAALLTTAAL